MNISDLQAYKMLLQLAANEGYQINTETMYGTKRGPMEFKGVLKQGGPSITNEVLAELARNAAKSGTLEAPLAEAFLRLSKNLEAGATVAQARRQTKAALEKEATTPGIGKRAIKTPEGTRYISSRTQPEIVKSVRTPIRSASGRPLAVKTADGKTYPLQLSPADYTHLIQLAKENPEASGWYQHKEGFDPVVSTEMFDEPMRQSVLRKTLERMKAAGQYGKGAKIVEMEANVPVERTRRSSDISGTSRETPQEAKTRVATNTPTTREHPTMVAEFLKGAAEESLASRTPSGRIRGGTPVVGRQGQVNAGKSFEYDLPAGVDQVLEEGKFLFTHPGSNKPVPIEDVEAWYRSQMFRGGKPDAQMAADLAKVSEARRNISYQSKDVSAADVALDKAVARKSREPERIDTTDPYAVSERRAFKRQMREEMTASDRRAMKIREAMEGTEFTKHEQPPKQLLSSEGQHKKLAAAQRSLTEVLKSQNVPGNEIAAIVKEAMAPYFGGARRLGTETIPGRRGGRATERGTIENFPNVGSKAIDISGGPAAERSAQVVFSRKGLSQSIKNLQKAEIAARVKAGQSEAQLQAAGLPLTYRKPGARPFDAAKTKSAVTSPFARTRGEEGYAEGALHNRGQALRTQIEDDVKALVRTKPTAEELHNGLMSMMDQYGEKHGLSPSSFMRIARGVDSRIEDLQTSAVTNAMKERQDKLKYQIGAYADEPALPSPRAYSEETVAHNLQAGREEQSRRQNALAILAELFPQLEGQVPEGLGAEIPMSQRPAARPDRPAEEVVGRAEALGAAAQRRQEQRETQDLERRVNARLQELLQPGTRRRAQQDIRRAAIGEDLQRQLYDWFSMLGEEGAQQYEPVPPRGARLEGAPPVETTTMEQIAAALGRAGRPVAGPAPAARAPSEAELKLQAAIRARREKSGSYKRPARRRTR